MLRNVVATLAGVLSGIAIALATAMFVGSAFGKDGVPFAFLLGLAAGTFLGLGVRRHILSDAA